MADRASSVLARRKTFENRNHHFTMEQFNQVIAFGDNESMQKKWQAFVRKIDTKTDDYSTVLKTIKAFLTEPFAAVVAEKEFAKKWSGQDNVWRTS